MPKPGLWVRPKSDTCIRVLYAYYYPYTHWIRTNVITEFSPSNWSMRLKNKRVRRTRRVSGGERTRIVPLSMITIDLYLNYYRALTPPRIASKPNRPFRNHSTATYIDFALDSRAAVYFSESFRVNYLGKRTFSEYHIVESDCRTPQDSKPVWTPLVREYRFRVARDSDRSC